jgi:hypothetical protein
MLAKLPSGRAMTGYTLFVQDMYSDTTSLQARSRFSAIAAEWKNMSQAEKQVRRPFPIALTKAYNEKAKDVTARRKQVYEAAVAKMSPHDIVAENSKRRYLGRHFSSAPRKNTLAIKDPRAPKRPMTSFLRYLVERHMPGTGRVDFKGHAQQWKDMSAGEKRVTPPPFVYGAHVSRMRRPQRRTGRSIKWIRSVIIRYKVMSRVDRVLSRFHVCIMERMGICS